MNVPKEPRKKGLLRADAKAGKFVGFDQPNLKAFRNLMPNGKVVTSRDVLFDESAAPASAVSDDTSEAIMLLAPPRALQPPAPSADRPDSDADTEVQAEVQTEEQPTASTSRIPSPPPASSAPAQDAVRRSSRPRNAPIDPYQKWTRWPDSQANAAKAASSDEHFTLVGSLLSPHP